MFVVEPAVYCGHTASIKTAKWMNDGKRIISASEDKTIRYVLFTRDSNVCDENLPIAPSF